MKDFKDKVLVVTGAGSGIGQALVYEGAKRGMKIVANDITKAGLDETVKTVKEMGGEIVAQNKDISLFETVEDLFQLTMDTYGQVDMLVNNAGCSVSGPIWEIPLQDIKWITEVNFLSHLYGNKVFIPQMIKQGTEADIINVESTAGLMTSGSAVMYHATKFGGVGHSEATYLALKGHGYDFIHLHCMAPAFVQTGIHECDKNRPERYAMNDDPYYKSQEFLAGYIRASRQVIAGMPIDHVGEIAFTACEDNKFWIFTHPESQNIALPRVLRVSKAENPQQ